MEDERRNNAGGRSILVAAQTGRDLLLWAIRNAAETGDHVIHLHVCRKSELQSPSLPSRSEALCNDLSECETLSIAKKVFLARKLAHGSSIKNAIVNELQTSKANTVVVGLNRSTFGSHSSISRYCERKLPPSVSLLAVHNGEVVYERKAAALPQASPSGCSGRPARTSLGRLLYPSLSMKSEGEMPPRSIDEEEEVGKRRFSTSSQTRDAMDDEEGEGKQSSNTKLQRAWGRLRSLSLLTEKASGWPLLRRASSENLSAYKLESSKDMSVVQWVMRLPERSLQSPQAKEGHEESRCSSGNFQAYADLWKKLQDVLRSSSSCRWFNRSELEESTSQFSPDNLIDNGRCSSVYRGSLSDGLKVAVKVTKISEEALRDFILEAEIITTVQHHHIAHLIGVCFDESEIISVFNFFSMGSLEKNLHGRKAEHLLPWSARYRVALGIAEALDYLHTNCPRSVIHRDVKSSNVLLNEDLEPRLSDFGLAVWAPNDSSSVIDSDVVGTFGYLAPEYFMYGKVSEKVDVYSFGVVLLELLTGRKPICSENSKGQENLVIWVTKMLEQCSLMDLLDPSIDQEENKEEIERMVVAASISIRRVARHRPKMSQVLGRGVNRARIKNRSLLFDSRQILIFSTDRGSPQGGRGTRRCDRRRRRRRGGRGRRSPRRGSVHAVEHGIPHWSGSAGKMEPIFELRLTIARLLRVCKLLGLVLDQQKLIWLAL